MPDVRIRWDLEVVGDPSGALLKQDRAIRTSLTATDRLQRKLATAATQGGRDRVRASQGVSRALAGESRQTRSTERDVAALNRAQAAALTSGSRVAASARRVADAYRIQAGAAQRLSLAERAKGRAQNLARGAASTGAGLSGATQGAIAAAAGGGIAARAIGVFAGFEQQMSRVQAVSGATGKQLGQLEKQAINLGGKTSFSAREAADGMYQLATAGFKTNQVMRIIPGTLSLAAASGVDLADAAELQASTLRGFGLQAGQAGRVADVLATTVNRSAVEMSDLSDSLKYVAPIARATGQGFESMSAALGIMGNVGVKGTQAGTTLRTALVRLTDPTTKAQGALKTLGLSAKDLQGPKGLIPLPAILGKVVRGAQDLDKGTRNQALARIFGREALSGMVALVSQGPKALNANIRALKNADGTAKRTAHTMRANVAGAWDQLTGSLETASITLVKRFSPALQGALKGAGSLTTRAAGTISAVVGGIAGDAPARGRVQRGPGGRVERVTAAEEPSKAAKIGQAIGGVARTVGTAAASAGKQLLDAFKPALPFLQNVLLPLLKGIGEGILVGIVGAFKIAVPIIRAVATVLGAIGKAAAPFKGVIEGIGVVIGTVFGGPLLGVIGKVGLLGKAFGILGVPLRLVGGAVKLLALPFRAVGEAAGLVARGIGKLPSVLGRLGSVFTSAGRAASHLPGVLGSFAGRVLASAGRLVTAAGRGLASLPAKLAVTAYSAGKAVLGRLSGIVGGLAKIGVRAVSALVGQIKKTPGALAEVAGGILGGFEEFGKQIVQKIIDGVKSAPGAVAGAVKDAVGGAAGSVFDFVTHVPGKRGGGRIAAFAGGGLVPILASGGELVVDGGRAQMVPGRDDRDGTLLMARPGSAVLTYSGQSLMAAGASLEQAIAGQAPHFAGGGRVRGGSFNSTSYGPPWTGINGSGVTATGVNLRGRPHLYGAAVDPRRIPLGSDFYAWPNPFGYDGRFRAFDTGSAIKGNRLDFYDWRGRKAQMGWGHHATTVGNSRMGRHGQDANTFTKAGGAGSSINLRMLGRDRLRGGLVEDAFTQGLDAGQGGLTRGAIRRQGNPILSAIRSALTQPDRGTRSSKAQIERASSGGYPPSSAMGRMVAMANRIDAKRYQYAWGGGHGRIGVPSRGSLHANGVGPVGLGFDCSGAVSAVLGAGGFLKSPLTSSGLMGWGVKGGGKRTTVYADAAHTIMRLGSRYFGTSGSNSRGGAGWLSSNTMAGRGVLRHPRGMRTGGIVGAGARSSQRLGVAASRAENFAPGAVKRLDSAIQGAADSALLRLQHSLQAAVRAGGPQPVVQRLRAMLSQLDFELGRRVGLVLAAVARRTDLVTRAQGHTDRYMRRSGIDASSSQGLLLASVGNEGDLSQARLNARDLRGALARARKAGAPRSTINDLVGQVKDAEEAVDEAVTKRAELVRQRITQAAQDRADTADFGLSSAQNRLSGIDAASRLAGGAAGTDTPAALRARAAGITATLIPALQGQRSALQGQADAAWKTGDVAGFRSAWLGLEANANDLAGALADAGDALRQAAETAAQDLVDSATHRETLATTGLARLELEQKLAGTFEGGGQARSDYITQNIVPALQAELTALQAQQATAAQEGDAKLADQIGEAVAAKQNDLLQSQLDALDEVASNTTPRRFGGTLGFSAGGESLTDLLVTTGNGF